MDVLNRIVLIFLDVLHWLMHLLGQLPYSVNIRTATFSSNKFWYIYSMIFVSTLVAIYYGTGLQSLQFQINGNEVTGLNGHMKEIDYSIEMFVAVAITVVQILKTDQTVAWSLQIREVFLKVRKIEGENQSFRGDTIFFALRMLLHFVAYLITNISKMQFTKTIDSEMTSWVTMIILAVPVLMILLCATIFSMVAICLTNCLSRINGSLASEVEYINQQSFNSWSKVQKINIQVRACDKIEDLDRLHAEVYRAIRKMNSIYSSRVFLIVTYLFLDIIVEFYFMCDNVTKRAKGLEGRSYLLETFAVLDLCFLAYELYFITNAGERLKRASIETGAILHRVHIINLDKRLERTIAEFSLRIRLYDTALKPLQLFEVNNSTLYQMAHGMTTFLIILVQFKIAENYEEIRKRNALFDTYFGNTNGN